MTDAVREIFQRYDRDGNGTLSCEELRAILKALGSFRDSEIKTIFNIMDVNHDGVINFEEFLDWLTAPTRADVDTKAKVLLAPAAAETLRAAFYAFCGKGRADLDGASFARLCRDCNLLDKRLSPTDVDMIFAKVMPRGKRLMEYLHFEAAVGLLAEKKGFSSEEVAEMISDTGGPRFCGTQAEATRFHDDQSRYRGARASLAEEPANHSAAQRRSLQVPVRHSDGGTTLEGLFLAFSSPMHDLDSKGFSNMCRDAGLFGSNFTPQNADIIFCKIVPHGLRRINFKQFKDALWEVSEKKGVDFSDMLDTLTKISGPTLTGRQPDAVRQYDGRAVCPAQRGSRS